MWVSSRKRYCSDKALNRRLINGGSASVATVDAYRQVIIAAEMNQVTNLLPDG